MKKIFFILLLAGIVSACKKNYNCQCGTTIIYNNGQDYYTSKNKPMSRKMTYKQAKAVCDHEADNIDQTYNNYWTNNGNWSAGGTSFHTNCIVK
jgi:hypothetical protein